MLWRFGAFIAIASFVLLNQIWQGPPLPSRGPASLSDRQGFSCERVLEYVCQERGEVHDPTGSVIDDAEGERQAVEIYAELREDNPEWDQRRLEDELVATIYTPARLRRVRAAFDWVVDAMIRYIERQPEESLRGKEKAWLIGRVRRLKLDVPPPSTVYADEPDLYTKNDVFYERLGNGTTRLRVGGAYLLTAKSWFNLVFTLAHETAHAIDPCEIRSARFPVPAYDRLSACFLQQGLIETRRTRSECGANDQLSETFADWVAVQLTSEALTSLATEFPGRELLHAVTNSVRDLCDDPDARHFSSEQHPRAEVRIERIFGHHPAIRDLLQCGPTPMPTPQYCGFESKIEHQPARQR